MKNIEWTWEEAQENAFSILKEALCTAPILAHPDWKKQFILGTDASGYQIGAVLSQLDEEGFERPIAFASRTLSKAEKNYSTVEREALALV